MTERDALFKIAWLHRQMLDHEDRLVCAECSTDEQPRWYPCETRLACDAVFSGPGVTYTSSDRWPETLPGSTPGVVTEPLDGAGLIAGDTSKVTVSTRGFAPPTV